MKKLKDEYKSFLDDIEKNIKNQDDLKYIKERFAKFMDIILESFDIILDAKTEEIENLTKWQQNLEDRMNKMQKVIDNIENDIYAEEGFDFEIICPYCNYEFIIDVDENKTEVQCPECKNMIELDWSGDTDNEIEDCSGHCSGCSGCEGKDEEDQEDTNNEDDM